MVNEKGNSPKHTREQHSKSTDLGFSYSARGEVTETRQKPPLIQAGLVPRQRELPSRTVSSTS